MSSISATNIKTVLHKRFGHLHALVEQPQSKPELVKSALLKSLCGSLNRWFREDEVEEEILPWKSRSSTSFRSVSS